MKRPDLFAPAALIALAAVATPACAFADTPRELLTSAAFHAATKPAALSLVGQAITASERILAAHPGDREATLQRAIAIGYRGKLTRNRSDVRTSLGIFERLAEQNPRDAEAQMVIAGWHLGAIDQLGSLVARAALGARSQVGEDALTRAVTLGGDRAFYPGFAAMLQIRRDQNDVGQALRWAQAAATAPASTPLDAVMKRAAITILPALRANDGKRAAELSRRLMPFGKLSE